MAVFTLRITTGNDAAQVSDIPYLLRDTARRIQAHGTDYVSKVMDDNGNAVGTVDLDTSDEKDPTCAMCDNNEDPGHEH
jgi:hypothetical protein